ncbi:DHH family phosphoesterase [Clostridium oryzae]|nr:bifunctional oligoribonuclease/PAP phosphatase NrnA [Clostridium oryzae]
MFSPIISTIKKAKNIAISFHVSPDGDSIGSSLGLMLALRKIGKNPIIVMKDTTPKFTGFLPHIEEIVNGDINPNVDCLIILDCGNVERVNCGIDRENTNYILINMDHHASNDYYGDINFVDTSYSSMGEIVYKLLEEMNIDIDQEIATCLYTSIITDCGSFKYSNTTKLTHEIAGNLIGTGINFSQIHSLIYDNKELCVVKLAGKVIENMAMYADGRICVLSVTENLVHEYGCDNSDISELVNIGSLINTVEVVVFFKETSDRLKVSLRSQKEYDVKSVAEVYGGGGHIKAAGFTYSGKIKDIEKQLIELISKGFN